MNPETLAQFTQFGLAGMIACMWLAERRAASGRERQLAEAHERLLEQRTQLDALMTLVADNARAVAALEAAQRSVAALLERLTDQRPPFAPAQPLGARAAGGTLPDR